MENDAIQVRCISVNHAVLQKKKMFILPNSILISFLFHVSDNIRSKELLLMSWTQYLLL